MRRSDLLIKFVVFIAFIAIVCYIGYSFYDSQVNPLRTVLAVDFTLDSGSETQGWIVREEQPIDGGGSVKVVARDGTKMANGETVAIRYYGAQARERVAEMDALELRIKQAENQLSSGVEPSGKLEYVMELAAVSAGGDYAGAGPALLGIDSYIFGSTGDMSKQELQAEIERLKGELSALELRSSGDTTAVGAPVSGLFSSTVDGFEGVGPDDLRGLTPSEYKELFAAAGDDSGVGKMVTGLTWYYVTVMKADDTVGLNEGGMVKLKFSRTWSKTLDMKLEELGENIGGERVVVFSSSSYLQELTEQRSMEAKVLRESVTGIRVPKEAVHLDEEGKTYVYILEGLQASVAYTDIVAQDGDYYLLSDNIDQGLREGAQIITRARGLYDGKVVQ